MLYFERWKMVLIALVCAAGLAYSLPNFFPKSSLENVPDWLPNKQVNLGLDLRGGSYMLLALDTKGLEQSRLQDLVGEVRNALRDARVGYTGLGIQNGAVVVSISRPEKSPRRVKLLKGLRAWFPQASSRPCRKAILP